jgi:acyl-CoA synthetase (AMP-forming)/AMP-acid ligase II
MRRPLLAWLDDPAQDKGIRFAAHEAGEWEFWSYERLAGLTWDTARGLADAGVAPDNVVTIIQRSGPHFVAALFGTMLLGAIPSPLAPPLAFQDATRYDEHVRMLVGRAASSAVITSHDLIDRVTAAAAPAGVRTILDTATLAAAGAGGIAAPPQLGPPRGDTDLALVQFTSGSSGHARGVRITFEALEANCAAIRDWLAMTPDDPTATWLPIHHDMGLIGCLITPVLNRSDIWVLEPEQFIQAPLRYLRCFGALGARLTAMPNFGLAYIARRIRPEQLDGLDFRQWRAVIVGAERVDPAVLDAFTALLAPHGLSRKAVLPAYGLAEATLAVTGLPLTEEPTSLLADPASCELGRELRLLPATGATGPGSTGPGSTSPGSTDLSSSTAPGAARSLTGCGYPLAGVTIQITGESGEPLPPGHVGEILVRGRSVAAGYLPGETTSGTSFGAGTLSTGDAGFIVGDQLYVLGRLGDSMKLRGRSVFAEDLEGAVCERAGVPAHRVVVLLGVQHGEPTAVAVVERCDPAWQADIMAVLRNRSEGARTLIIDAPAATIERTSSGKPRRRVLWRQFTAGTLPGTLFRSDASHGSDAPRQSGAPSSGQPTRPAAIDE